VSSYFLKSFERFDADVFRDCCSISFVRWARGDHFAFWGKAAWKSLPEKYHDIDLLAHLVTIGLIGSPQKSDVSVVNDWSILHFEKRFHLEAPPTIAQQPEFFVSIALFTAVGEQLARVVQASPAVGLIENLSEELKLLRARIVQVDYSTGCFPRQPLNSS
jgi:hypothetical protein